MYIEKGNEKDNFYKNGLYSDFFKSHPLYSYQEKILNEDFDGAEVIFLDAPTGAGKTFSFILPVIGTFQKDQGGLLTNKVVIVEPTNQIIDEDFEDIKSISNSFFQGRIYAEKITGENRKNCEKRAREIIRKPLNDHIILTNPDIISLFISNYYHTKMDLSYSKKIGDSREFFSEINYIIFDEYHSYESQSIGKLIAFVLMIKNSKLFSNLKIIFASGTPSKIFKDLLKKHLDPSVKILESFSPRIVYGNSDFASQNNFIQFRGETEIIFTDKDIDLESDYTKRDRKRRMYLFNKVVEMEKFGNKLRGEGFLFESISRIDNKNKQKIKEKKDNDIIIATATTMELGSNKNPDIAHIQMGYNLESALQRIGRVSRRGKSGKIIVHLDSELVEFVESIEESDSYKTYEYLVEQLEKVVNKKILDIGMVNANIGAMLYHVFKRLNSNDPYAIEIAKIGKKFPMFKSSEMFDSFSQEVENILIENGRDKNRVLQEIGDFKKWKDAIVNSFRFFRGSILEVDIRFSRGNETIKSSQNLIWIKRFTDFEYLKEEQEYKINNINDEANNNFNLFYPSLLKPSEGFHIEYLKAINKVDFQKCIKNDFNIWFEYNFSNNGEERLKKFEHSVDEVINNLNYKTLQNLNMEVTEDDFII